MQILRSVREMRDACKGFRRDAACLKLALVPTMGALHEGHLSLVRAARRSCDRVAVSLFVNPLQFGASEDFLVYPQTFEQDCSMLDAEGVDLLFVPSAREMYPTPMQTWVDVPEVGGRLDGRSRPGHFRGVATVVSKLFNIVQPDEAFFGQKDAAQVAVLRTMVRDLNFDVELVVCPTLRDDDGVALSSRNRNLSKSERETAQALSRSLHEVQRAILQGQHSVPVLKEMLQHQLHATEGVRLDYAEIVDPETLEERTDLQADALVAVAAWVGKTRLIDNLVVSAEGSAT